jgi:glycogen(starch) synthase
MDSTHRRCIAARWPSVSVIINTLDRAASLDHTLAGVRRMRYPSFEILVVPGPCADHTAAVLDRHWGAIRVEFCPDANLSKSRNIGIRHSAGDVLVFIDDDSVPEPDWLCNLVHHLSRPEVAAAGGFIRGPLGVKFQYQLVVANRFGEARSCPPPAPTIADGEFLSPTGTNVAFRREVLVGIGGFDEEYGYFLEETDVNLRLHEQGWKIKFSPAAEVHHFFLRNQHRDVRRVPRSLYRIGRSKAYFCWKHAAGWHSDDEIHARIEAYRAERLRRLRWLVFRGRLPLSEARRLRVELDQGIQDGTDTARRRAQGDTSPAMTPTTPIEDFHPCAEQGLTERKARLCFVSREGPSPAVSAGYHAALPAALARLGHEVTVIFPGAHPTTVGYSDGVWHHRIPLGFGSRYRSWRRFAQAASQEIVRIQERRQFEVVLCPEEAREALSALSATGLPTVLVDEGLSPVSVIANVVKLSVGSLDGGSR